MICLILEMDGDKAPGPVGPVRAAAEEVRAREPLARSDLSVTDVALELGFTSSQHFAAYKALTG